MIYMRDATLTWLQDRPATRTSRIPVDDEYFERFWLPVIGPTSFCLMRWANRERVATFPIADIGPRIGLGINAGKNSPIWRTINRMIMFGMIDQSQTIDTSLFVWSAVRPLSKRHLSTLPDAVHIGEEAWWRDRSADVVPIFRRGSVPLIGVPPLPNPTTTKEQL